VRKETGGRRREEEKKNKSQTEGKGEQSPGLKDPNLPHSLSLPQDNPKRECTNTA